MRDQETIQRARDRNLAARHAILAEASRNVRSIYKGAFTGSTQVQPFYYGLVTHFTVDGDWSGLDRITFYDLSNNTRIKCSTDMFKNDAGRLLLPIANVYFNNDPEVAEEKDAADYVVKDLRGAMWLNVVNATSMFVFDGVSKGMIVRQHYMDHIPSDDKYGYPALPIMDLSVINTFIDGVHEFKNVGLYP